MSRLEELLQQQKDLEKEIKEVAKNERAEALKTVRNLCKQYGFTMSMLQNYVASGRPRKAKKS